MDLGLALVAGVVDVALGGAVGPHAVAHVRQVDADAGERVAVVRVARVAQHVRRRRRVGAREEEQVLQAEQAHAAKVGRRIVALKADLLPAVADPRLEPPFRHQQLARNPKQQSTTRTYTITILLNVKICSAPRKVSRTLQCTCHSSRSLRSCSASWLS